MEVEYFIVDSIINSIEMLKNERTNDEMHHIFNLFNCFKKLVELELFKTFEYYYEKAAENDKFFRIIFKMNKENEKIDMFPVFDYRYVLLKDWIISRIEAIDFFSIHFFRKIFLKHLINSKEYKMKVNEKKEKELIEKYLVWDITIKLLKNHI